MYVSVTVFTLSEREGSDGKGVCLAAYAAFLLSPEFLWQYKTLLLRGPEPEWSEHETQNK